MNPDPGSRWRKSIVEVRLEMCQLWSSLHVNSRTCVNKANHKRVSHLYLLLFCSANVWLFGGGAFSFFSAIYTISVTRRVKRSGGCADLTHLKSWNLKRNNGEFDLLDDAELRYRIDTLEVNVKMAFQLGLPVKKVSQGIYRRFLPLGIDTKLDSL